jgi:tetratricopeptide (TPR) repeat protein
LHAKGYEARKRGDYQAAIKHYSDALHIMPNHFKALFNRGFAYDKIS